MWSTLSHFHFIRPWWLLTLLPLLALILFLKRRFNHQHNWAKVCDAHLLPYLLQQKTGSSFKQILFLLSIIGVMITLALAGPTWRRLPQPVFTHNNARIILLDLSEDIRAADLLPSRLVRARYKLRDMLNDIKDGQTALIAYSGEPYLVSPLTEDTQTIAAMVPNLSPDIMPVQGNDLAAALNMAQKLLQQSDVDNGQIIVLAASSISEAAIKTAKKIAAEGTRVSVLAVGTGKNAPMTLPDGQYVTDKTGAIVFSHLDMSHLQELAQAGQGQYVAFHDNNEDINILLKKDVSSSSLKKSNQQSATTEMWKDEGHWFIWLLLPFAALAFRRGWLGKEMP